MNPNDDRQPYHLELTDGVSTVGLILCDRNGNEEPRAFSRTPIPRSSLKIYTGEQKHSDLEPPWTDVIQEDWGGGQGGATFEDDQSRYWDSYRMDTTRGYVVRGSLERFAKGIRNWDGFWSDGDAVGYSMRKLYGDSVIAGTTTYGRYHAMKFTASASYTAVWAWLYLSYTGTPGTLTVEVYTDSGGSPDAAVIGSTAGTITTATAGAEAYARKVVRTAISAALTSGTVYWLVVYGASTDSSSNYWELVGIGDTGATMKTSPTVIDWTERASKGFLARLTDAEDPFRAHFAILKNSLYAGLEYLDGGTSAVYINGTAGTATSGGATTLVDTNNAGISADDLYNNAIVYLWDGPGSSIHRRITDTDTGTKTLTVADWGITPTSATKYAVVDTERFSLAGTYATATSLIITDVVSANGALYWCAGDAATAYVRRLRHGYTGGGSPTYFNWTDETASGTLIKSLTDGRAIKLWLANRSLPGWLKSADAPDCTTSAGTAPTFTAATAPGDLEVKTTGLCVYGEGFPRIHVLKEDSIIEYIGDQPQELRIAALKNVRDGWNGIASCVNDVYLYFGFLDRVQRYYSGQLDDIGPDLPTDRRGKVLALVAYPGRLYAAVDGGPYNYSTIQCYNGRGWCEVYRAPTTGLRILNAFIQPIPGVYNADRLWFSCGSDIVSLSLELKPDPAGVDTTQYNYYRWAPGGYIESGWMYLGLQQVDKLFNSIAWVRDSDALLTDDVTVLYKTDEASTWTYLGTVAFTRGVGKPSVELQLDSTTYNVTGRRIKFRVVLKGQSSNGSSKLLASVLEALVTVPHKYATTITFRLEDNAETLQLNGQDSYTDADTKFAQLDTWASSAGTVGLTSHVDALNGKRVKIEPASVQLLRREVSEVNGRKRNRYLCQAVLLEVD